MKYEQTVEICGKNFLRSDVLAALKKCEPEGPEDIWIVIDDHVEAHCETSARSYAEAHGLTVVHYRRADLAQRGW